MRPAGAGDWRPGRPLLALHPGDVVRASEDDDRDRSDRGYTAEAVGKLVTARMDRQVILGGEHPPMLWYVIDEGVLRHVVGSRTVMAGQVDRVIEAAGTPGAIVNVTSGLSFSPLARAELFARSWGSRFVVLERAGHINADSSFGVWPQGRMFLKELTGAS